MLKVVLDTNVFLSSNHHLLDLGEWEGTPIVTVQNFSEAYGHEGDIH